MHGSRRLVRLLVVGAGALVMAALGAVPAAAGSPHAGAARSSFTCAEVSGGAVSGMPSPVRDVKVRTNHRIDQFVIKLGGPLQQFDVRPQDSATFVQDPSGLPVTLEGGAGLLVVLHGAQAHGSFQGPTDLTPGFPTLL